MKKILLPIIVAVVIIATIIVGIRLTHKPSSKEEVLKIGAILPLTGNLAFLGEPERDALQVAINELRSGESGSPIKLFIEDSKGQAKDAVSAAQKLLNVEKVHLGIVSASALSNAVAPLFQEAGVPLITICSDDTIPQRYRMAVNIYVNLESEQETMANFIVNERISQLSVIRVNAQITERGIKLLQEKSKGSLSIVDDLTYELGTTDYRNLVTKVKSDASQAIYLMGYGVEFPTLVKTLREMGVEKRIFGNYMFLSDAARKEGTGLYKDIDFTAFSVTPADIIKTPFGKEFAKARGGSLGPFMDYLFVYEAVRIWYQTVKEVSSELFPEYIRGKAFDSLLGQIKIDNTGNAISLMTVATYAEDGGVTTVWKGNK